jgi:hypothetical protein
VLGIDSPSVLLWVCRFQVRVTFESGLGIGGGNKSARRRANLIPNSMQRVQLVVQYVSVGIRDLGVRIGELTSYLCRDGEYAGNNSDIV